MMLSRNPARNRQEPHHQTSRTPPSDTHLSYDPKLAPYPYSNYHARLARAFLPAAWGLSLVPVTDGALISNTDINESRKETTRTTNTGIQPSKS